MLMDSTQSFVLVVDVQERLIPAIPDNEQLIANIAWLLGVAAELEVPIRASEQYPKGLGRLVEPLRKLIPEQAIAEKTHFSCAESPICRSVFAELEQQQVVIAGVESHVCVLQTAIGLLQEGREVFVVADAVGSRNPRDQELALERLRACGVTVVTREMVAFEWLREAGTSVFKRISQRFLR